VATLTPQQAFELAQHHFQNGQLAEASQLCHQLLAIYPGDEGTLHLLGLISLRLGDAAQARNWLHQAILTCPGNADFHNALGEALQTLGHTDESVVVYQRAHQFQPLSAPILNNLGNALRIAGRLEEACSTFREALRIDPTFAEIHINFASVLRQQGKLPEAIATLRHALILKPGIAMGHNNLGHALLDNGEIPEAITVLQQALALQPDLALAHNNLGSAFKMNGQIDEAFAAYRRALECDPTNTLALANFANESHEFGDHTTALALYERAVQSPHLAASAFSNYLAVLHCAPTTTLASLAKAHAVYEQRYASILRSCWSAHANSRDLERPLRLGFVSPYFGNHPVGFFLVRVIENLDPRAFEVVCYHDRRKTDDMTTRLRACAAQWRDVCGLPDVQLAAQIRADRIDILFDLEGHNAGNRLLVFARKPAPIQITWLDYVGTTGLSAIDYILADPRQVPPEGQPYYSEKVLRVPDDYICFDPPMDAPPVGPLPAETNGFVTFVSHNIVAKTTVESIGIWSRILRELSSSRLILGNRGFDTPRTIERVRKQFAECAVDPERISFRGWLPRAELLAAYNEADIALDTLPYNGGLTTCEAMWMGVPVVTCPGETFASRHGLAHLTAAGVPETIACNANDYVATAVALASDLPRLASLRATLRTRMETSPLCDGPRFAAHFAHLLRSVWQKWCNETREDCA
jgi:predicted O-linked N-acetylglucosamine transferase (SPINDLY family)